MKTNLISRFKVVLTLMLVAVLISSSLTFAAGSVSQTKSTNQVSDWAQNLIDLYQFENPNRLVTKGEFMFVQLRTIQASLERRGLDKLSAENEVLTFKDKGSLSKSETSEVKVLKSLGVLTGTPDGYMQLDNVIKRSEAAKVLSVLNNKIYKISSLRFPKTFDDTKGHWSESSVSTAYQITLLNGVSSNSFKPNDSLNVQQTLQILENTAGYYGITREDIAKAFNQTFNTNLNTLSSNSIISKRSYVKYEEKMNHYRFNQLYNNNSAKTDETVTKGEAIKMAIAVSLNLSNVDYLEQYIRDVTAETSINYDDKVTYVQAISYFENCKRNLLSNNLASNAKVYLKDFESYSTEQQSAIRNMVGNGIIYLAADKLNGNEYAFKGQINELAVNFAEKYSTVALTGDKVNTDPEKVPYNASEFPYISAYVDKAIYEKPLIRIDSDFVDALENYHNINDRYDEMIELVEEYLTIVLNVDYKTLDKEKFKSDLRNISLFNIDDNIFNTYFEYVEKNKIQMSGSFDIQKPIIYYDGFAFRVRTNVTFNVHNAVKMENLIFSDLRSMQPKKYKSKNTDTLDMLISRYYNVDQFAVYVAYVFYNN